MKVKQRRNNYLFELICFKIFLPAHFQKCPSKRRVDGPLAKGLLIGNFVFQKIDWALGWIFIFLKGEVEKFLVGCKWQIGGVNLQGGLTHLYMCPCLSLSEVSPQWWCILPHLVRPCFMTSPSLATLVPHQVILYAWEKVACFNYYFHLQLSPIPYEFVVSFYFSILYD
jgi:hypothetical protein